MEGRRRWTGGRRVEAWSIGYPSSRCVRLTAGGGSSRSRLRPRAPFPSRAWGFSGHKFITDRAIDLLPSELRPFFQQFRTTVVEHSIDPDTYRTMGCVEEPPRHFLDMDAYGAFPFKDLPHDYKEAVDKRGADFVIKNGTVPWRAEEIYNQLRDAFKQLPAAPYARDNIKLFSAVLAHYVGDSFQPLHACLNYDGQLTNQQGIHSRFESELFERYETKLRITPAPVATIPNAREFVFATLGRQLPAGRRRARRGPRRGQGTHGIRRWVFLDAVRESRPDHGAAHIRRGHSHGVIDHVGVDGRRQAGASARQSAARAASDPSLTASNGRLPRTGRGRSLRVLLRRARRAGRA